MADRFKQILRDRFGSLVVDLYVCDTLLTLDSVKKIDIG